MPSGISQGRRHLDFLDQEAMSCSYASNGLAPRSRTNLFCIDEAAEVSAKPDSACETPACNRMRPRARAKGQADHGTKRRLAGRLGSSQSALGTATPGGCRNRKLEESDRPSQVRPGLRPRESAARSPNRKRGRARVVGENREHELASRFAAVGCWRSRPSRDRYPAHPAPGAR
jgi:hypothetical protein